jgi:hypothetical protein
MFIGLVVQVNTGLLSGYRRDASVRSIGVGWPELAADIEAMRAKTGARCVLAPEYGTTSWLLFYLPKGTCVAQRFERIRWVNGPQPDPEKLTGKLLYVDNGAEPWSRPARYFNRIDKVATMERKRGPLVVETFDVDVVTEPKGPVLEPLPPDLR